LACGRMRLTDNDRQLLRVVAVLFAAFLAIQVFVLMWQAIGTVADVLLIFVVAWALAYLLGPLVRRIDEATPFDRTISVIIAFLMLIDGDPLWRRFLARLPTDRRREAEMFRESADRSFGGFIRGSLILGTIYGIATFLILVAFGVPFAGVLAVVSGLTMII